MSDSHPNEVRDYDGTHQERFASHLVSTDEAGVNYRTRITDGNVEIVRGVTKAAYRAKDRVGLWDEVIASLSPAQARELAIELFDSYAESAEEAALKRVHA